LAPLPLPGQASASEGPEGDLMVLN
jgi:hypothetical protein